MLYELWYDKLEDVGVTLDQIETRFAFLLPSAGRHDAQFRVGGDGVVRAGLDLGVAHER